MKVYLCGPINGCTDAECTDWRESVKVHFPSAVDPMRRDYRGREAEGYREIVERDKRDIDQCDVVLVNYVKPSVGTSMEILYTWQHHKPVILICREGENLSPWLRYHCQTIVHSIEDAVASIRELAA